MAIQSNFPSVRPSLLLDFASTKQLDPRISFSRASTATFYNGVTTSMAEQNLFTYSQEFDNAAWVKSATTVTANTIAAPDGTTTADSMFETTATTGHNLGQSFTTINGSTYIFSAYVKANGRNFCALYIGGANKGKFFDITAGGGGSVGGDLIGAPTSAALTYVGNDWYRVSITVVVTASSSVQIFSCDTISTFAFTGDVTKGLYLWGAQLENRSAISAYTATTTQAITNYIPVLQTAASGVARFDNNPTTGESLGLLIEESRTNLLTYSSQFDNAAWGKANATVTADTIVAPDGTLTGDKLVDTATSATHRLEQTQTVTNGASYTISVFAKAAERSWLAIYEDSGPSNWAFFNLTTGAVGTVNAGTSTITSVGNGWYRCTLTYTQVGTSGRVRIAVSTGNTTFTYTGDGYSGIYIWGAQFEAGGFSTSYVPTVASQVTRAADAASMTGTNFSSWFNNSEGTLFAQVSRPTLAGVDAVLVALTIDGSLNNTYELYKPANGQNFQVYMAASGVLQAGNAIPVIFNANTTVKAAGVYKFNDVIIAASNVLSSADTSAIVPAFNQLTIGLRGTFLPWNGTIAKIAYYPLRVTNAQLQSLTS